MRRASSTRLVNCLPVQAAIAFALAILLTAGAMCAGTRPALALSEIQGQGVPGSEATPTSPSDQQIEQKTLPPIDQVPIPGSATPDQPAQPDEVEPGDENEPGDAARPEVDLDAPIPPVLYDLNQLPEPVKRTHDGLVEACKSGDIERLRPFIEKGDNGTQLSFGGIDGDPIAYLKDLSGDKQGAETLAILEEVLDAGYVHMDAGTADEMYVWPYFFAVPLDKLNAQQRVELFKIVTAGDYDDMKTYGSYIFYRVGITPDGRWSFFVAGD